MQMKRLLATLISTGCYVGYVPVGSGTVACVWGALIYLGLCRFRALYIFVTIFLFVIGFLVCGKAEKIFKEKDSRKIVIDEIASMCLVYVFIKPSWLMIVSGFLLFRVFDIIKPPPARRLQAFPGSMGVMLDDVAAACYTIAILFTVSALLK
ncbi:MAG: phosphatidylglycerophosphatase A [Candidatus Omnitrophota bacterium]|nr:phosphatidylglycerophosphatase A [Candidatus Omnitrophota bacterium]